MKFYLKRRIDIKEVFLLAILVLQAMILSLIDLWIPSPFQIPELKLGLANIITICTLIFFKFSYTVIILLGRCILSLMFMGAPAEFLYSMCGGVLSAFVMLFILKTMQNWFGITAISIAGSVANFLGQIIAAFFIMNDYSVLRYFLASLSIVILIGYLLGICSTFLVKNIKKLNMIPNL